MWIVDAQRPDPAVIAEAARIVRSGGLVAFPTETVYGLAADATNPLAMEQLNRVKGRPPEKPYSMHLSDRGQVAAMAGEIPPKAQRLMDALWPGPLTIVLPAVGGGTIGFRLPDHPVALAFLKACGRPVAAPSANRSGEPPPTDARQVIASGLACDGVLDAGPTPRGRESTVVSVLGGAVRVLREGAVSAQQVLAAVGSG